MIKRTVRCAFAILAAPIMLLILPLFVFVDWLFSEDDSEAGSIGAARDTFAGWFAWLLCR